MDLENELAVAQAPRLAQVGVDHAHALALQEVIAAAQGAGRLHAPLERLVADVLPARRLQARLLGARGVIRRGIAVGDHGRNAAGQVAL